MNVGSLFSGIGGFDLGLERAGFKIEWQVEIDAYARRVLKKHWPNVPCYGDIRAIDWATVTPVDVLCGGFPCQDLSYAGKRAGLREGTRSGLWFEYLRAIRTLRPKYILVENVPGLLDNHALGRVLGDLAESGYDAEWDCLPANAFGAAHRRDRIWLLAYTRGKPCNVWKFFKQNGFDSHEWWSDSQKWGIDRVKPALGTSLIPGLATSWKEVDTESRIPRMVDGVPNGVDRLRGLGNAVVPQIVEALGRMIMEAERVKHAT